MRSFLVFSKNTQDSPEIEKLKRPSYQGFCGFWWILGVFISCNKKLCRNRYLYLLYLFTRRILYLVGTNNVILQTFSPQNFCFRQMGCTYFYHKECTLDICKEVKMRCVKCKIDTISLVDNKGAALCMTCGGLQYTHPSQYQKDSK